MFFTHKITAIRPQGLAVWLAIGLFSLALAPTPCSAQFWRAPVRDSNHVTSYDVCSWMALKRQNVIMQKRDYSCGAAALATLMRYYWLDQTATEEKILNKLPKALTAKELQERIRNGLTMTDLEKLANEVGYDAVKLKGTFSELAESKSPVIVGIVVRGFDHFVVVRGVGGPWVYLADSSRGNIRVPIDTFVSQWQENAMLVIAPKGAEDLPPSSPLALRRGELMLGVLNDQAVRTSVMPPPVPFPLSPMR